MTDAVNRAAYLNGYNAFREESNNSVWDVGKNGRGNASSNELVADFAIGLRDYLDNGKDTGNDLKIQANEAALNPEVKKIFDFLLEMKADKEKKDLNSFDLAAFIHVIRNNTEVAGIKIGNGDASIEKAERDALINAYLSGDTQTKNKIEDLFEASMKEVKADVRLQHNAQQRKLFDETIDGKAGTAALANLGYNSPRIVDVFQEGGDKFVWKIPVREASNPKSGMDKTKLVAFATGLFQQMDTDGDGIVKSGEFTGGRSSEKTATLFKALTFLQPQGPAGVTDNMGQPYPAGTAVTVESLINLFTVLDKGDDGIVTGDHLREFVNSVSFGSGAWGSGHDGNMLIREGDYMTVNINWDKAPYNSIKDKGTGNWDQASKDILEQAKDEFGGRIWGLNKLNDSMHVVGDETITRAMARSVNKKGNSNKDRWKEGTSKIRDAKMALFQVPNAMNIASDVLQLALKTEDFGVLADADPTIAAKRQKELEDAKKKAAESAEKAETNFQDQKHQQALQQITFLGDPGAGSNAQGTFQIDPQQAMLQNLLGGQQMLGYPQQMNMMGGGMMDPSMMMYGMQPNMMMGGNMMSMGMGGNMMGMGMPSFGYNGFMA